MDVPADGDRLLRQVIRYGGGWTTTLAATALVGAAAELTLPAVLGLAVDAALGDSGAGWLALAGGLLLLIMATDTLGDLAGGYSTARAVARLRHHLVRHLLMLDPRTAARYPVGDLVTRIVGPAADAGQAGVTVVFGLIALLPPVGSVVALTLLEPWLGVTFLLGLVLLAVLMRAFVVDASAAVAGYQQTQGVIAGRLLEALGGTRTIAAAGTVRQEVERVLDPLPQLRRHGQRTWSTLARATTRNASVAPLSQLSIVAVGGWSVSTGWLTPGQLFAAVQYAALGAGLGAVVATLNRLVRTRAGARRVQQLLGEPAQPHGRETLSGGDGTLTLHGVTVLGDGDRPVLDRVDLCVPGGTTLAVVGRSGAGKSTLAAVAGRLRDPDAGTVLLDGVALPRLSRAALRDAIGYGFERPVLVGDTIADVLRLGDGTRSPGTGWSPADLRRATGAAAIDDFVERLPHGYRTRTADVPMSGGQAQRLGLARALSARRLLILDDATSSVDTVTEHRMAQAVTAHLDGRTRLIVTHRAATAAAADLVAWLDSGRLRASGHHRDLWADPAYRAIFLPPAETARVPATPDRPGPPTGQGQP